MVLDYIRKYFFPSTNMVTSKIELLVDFGPTPDENLLNKTLGALKEQKGVEKAVYKDGAIMVETTLPSSVVVNIASTASGKRTVLQGFGDSQSAVAMVSGQSCCSANVLGVIRFHQATEGPLIVEGTVDGLKGTHGLHVHESGDLSNGCLSIGDHYNPKNRKHGGPNDEERHAGDLGNIKADDNGRSTFRILDNVLQIHEIIGRSVGISENEDDFGKGESPNSTINGNCGKIIACGIIARSAGVFENPKRICACDGVVVWDERDRPLAGKGRRIQDTCCKRETEDATEKACCKF